MLSTGKSHMLEKVGTTFLSVIFLNSAKTHHQPHLNRMGGSGIGKYQIMKTIVQPAFHRIFRQSQ